MLARPSGISVADLDTFWLGLRGTRRRGLVAPRSMARDLAMNQVFRALSDPTRRRVLQLLRERPMTAGELASHFESAKGTMSAHFSVLREADLIEAHKNGKSITYSLKLSVLEDALLAFAETFGIGLSGEASRTARAR